MLVVLTAVVVSFVGVSAFSENRAAKIGAAATAIADDAAPGIEHLAAARAELRRLQALTADYVNDAVLGRPIDRSAIDTARAELSRQVEAYLMLPVVPGERERWAKVAEGLADLDRISNRVFSLVATGHAREANELADTELRAAIDRTAETTFDSIRFNAWQAHQLATTIESDQLHARAIAFELTAATVLLALAAGGLAIRHIRQQEALLRAHERLLEHRAAELEQFAGRVAHDVLGPLTTVMLAFQVATRVVAGDEKNAQNIARGKRSIERVHSIVDGLYEFARAGARPEPDARAEVGSVLEDVASELRHVAKDAGAVLIVEPFAPCAVAASPGVLTSVVSNLVRNAIKYLGDSAARSVVVRVRESGDRVHIDVQDSGPGVPLDLQDVIFEPYARLPGTEAAGLGLGLATVKRLVEAHGGRVGCRSTPGAGSLFWVELPRARDGILRDSRSGESAPCVPRAR